MLDKEYSTRHLRRFLRYFFFANLLLLLKCQENFAQANHFGAISAKVDFSAKLRPWDGFGFNYVQTSQTFDYDEWPQDYGGFRFLKENDKRAITELIFGKDGLKVGLLKVFLDPLHQEKEGGPYDHQKSTGSLIDFAKRGWANTKAAGRNLSIITTLYGPPAYMTQQKIIRGRDLDTAHTNDLVNYLVDWAAYLRKVQDLPLKYVSLHNEGEDWLRWPQDGALGDAKTVGHDYNLYWPPHQVVKVMKLLRPALDKAGLKDVGVTPGENTNWYRFSHWGYARAINDDQGALNSMSLITSHGFYVGDITAAHWYAPHSNVGIELLRGSKDDLHSWVTSTAWQIKGNVMSEAFIKEIHGSIYEAKVNGIIPWGGIQTASQWNKPDPNPGCAIRVFDDGTWEIEKGYYYYKQVSRAGQPGMAVALTEAMSSEISLIAFSANGTKNADAFVIINQAKEPRKVAVTVKGCSSLQFEAYRTTGEQVYQFQHSAKAISDESDNYKYLGCFSTSNGILQYEAVPGSVTTFFAR